MFRSIKLSEKMIPEDKCFANARGERGLVKLSVHSILNVIQAKQYPNQIYKVSPMGLHDITIPRLKHP